MILEAVFNLIKGILNILFGILPTIPNLPDNLHNSISSFFDLIFENATLLGLFVRIDTLKVLLPIVIVIMSFDKLYKFTMWIIKKLPFSIS